jgi:hypothetical protein
MELLNKYNFHGMSHTQHYDTLALDFYMHGQTDALSADILHMQLRFPYSFTEAVSITVRSVSIFTSCQRAKGAL